MTREQWIEDARRFLFWLPIMGLAPLAVAVEVLLVGWPWWTAVLSCLASVLIALAWLNIRKTLRRVIADNPSIYVNGRKVE